VTGRARVVAYNTRKLTERDLPDSIFGFTDPKWKGRIGWPPTNGSFQAFVTALRVQEGDQRARQWLEGIKANQPKAYSNNTTALEAVASGEVDVAFINHYYLYTQLVQKGPSYPVRNYYPRAGDAGAMVNVAGVGVLASSKHREAALRLVDYLLSPEAQRYFAGETPEDAYEYPLVKGVPTHPDLQPLASIKTPQIDLGSLSDLDGTLKMLREVGLIS
jgi:iron(III) transport system substrate-binding protein